MGSWELSLSPFSPQDPALCGGTSSLNLPWTPSIHPPPGLSPLPSSPLHLSLFSLFSLLQAKVKLILFHNFLSARFLLRRLESMAPCLKDVIKVKTKWIPVSDKVNNVFFFPPPYPCRYIRCTVISHLIKSPTVSFLFFLFFFYFFEYEYKVDASGDSLHIRELIWARSQKGKDVI